MKNILFLSLILLVSCGGGSGSGNKSGATRSASPATATDGLKSNLLNLVNNHRANLGMGKLILAQPLTSEILKHTDNMANGLLPLGHMGMSARCSNAKNDMGGGNLCGEIVAQSSEGATANDVFYHVHQYSTLKSIFSQWMNSYGHRAKIEDPRYNRVGIGMSLDNDNDLYSGMLFLEFE